MLVSTNQDTVFFLPLTKISVNIFKRWDVWSVIFSVHKKNILILKVYYGHSPCLYAYSLTAIGGGAMPIMIRRESKEVFLHLKMVISFWISP